MVRPPKGTGEQIRLNLVMNAIEAMGKVGDQPRELVRNALDPSDSMVDIIASDPMSCGAPTTKGSSCSAITNTVIR